MSESEWSIVTTTGRGALPSPRCGHTLSLTGAGDSSSRHLVVAFGETTKTKERKFFNDVYALSNGREWNLLNITGRVPVLPRSNHSATVFGEDLNSILFFGGTSLHSFLDDTLVLSGVGGNNPKWIPIYSVKNPNGRRGHSMLVKPNSTNEFILFGGQRGNVVLNDLWQFDVATGVWTELRSSGDIPAPRAFHTAFTVNSNLCVFGGMDSSGMLKESDVYTSLYDTREGRWNKISLGDPNLSGDFHGHFIGAPFYKLVLYGSKTTRDTYVVDIDPESGAPRGPATVLEVYNNGFQPERRNRPASALMYGDPFRLFVFGGWKIDSDPPVASAGLRCLTFRAAISDIVEKSVNKVKVFPAIQNTFLSDEFNISTRAAPTVIKRIKLSQRPVKSRAAPSSLRADDVGHMALLKIKNQGGIASSLQVDSKHDDTSLAFSVIEDLWLQPIVAFSGINEERSSFFLSGPKTLELIRKADALFRAEPNVLEIDGQTKIFGDIHGQFEDLCRLFKAFGSPDHHIGDIEECKYVFLGDIVDRGRHSLEVLCLLIALKIQYPLSVFLVRGNHEDSAMNKNYGFGTECMSRFGGEAIGAEIWTAFDNLFNVLPLAAIINKRILCVHGGIGRLETIDQIRKIPRPSKVDHDPSKGDQVLMDILWSDPAESDAETGISENKARRVSVVFGADRVTEFCARNEIDVIIRAHQCVMEGYEYFAKGHLITIFSATNYCGVQRNNGAILHVTERSDHWLIIPKFIECDLTPNTWVNLSQLPPSPMRSAKRQGETLFSNSNTMAVETTDAPLIFDSQMQGAYSPAIGPNSGMQPYSQQFVSPNPFAAPFNRATSVPVNSQFQQVAPNRVSLLTPTNMLQTPPHPSQRYQYKLNGLP